MADITSFLRSIADLWQKQIAICEKAKERDFGRAAKEVMEYVGKRYAPLTDSADIQEKLEALISQNSDQTYLNYTQAFVDIMTPYVFAKVPNRLASPRRPQIPPELEAAVPQVIAMQDAIKQQDTMTSFLLQWWLNWSPKIYDLTSEGGMVVREALAKGRGVAWLEMVDGPYGPIPSSNADSVDNLLIDADCKQLRDAGFIVRKRERVVWRVSDEFGEKPEDLRASARSNLNQAMLDVPGIIKPDDPTQGDLCTYYEFWSVMGLGDKLVGAPQEFKELKGVIDLIGPYVHFCIMPGLDHPLGMSPEKLSAETTPEALLEMLSAMLAWPIKTYGNANNPWPMRCLDFKKNIDNPWSKSILEAAMPLQRFLDRLYRSLINRAKTAGRDIVLTSAAIEESLDDALKSLNDFELVKINDEVSQKEIEKLVNFLKFPEVNKDLFQILAVVDKAFREITGMSSALFGEIPQSQDRSATATNVREAGISRRPDDYADIVEAWMSEVACLEAIATRLLVDPETVAPLFGEEIQTVGGQMNPMTGGMDGGQPVYGPLTSYWIQYVQTNDPSVAAAEVEYSVEAGSGRRRNKQLLKENANQLFTMLAPVLQAMGEGGDWEPFLELVATVGNAYDMPSDPIIRKFKESIAKQQMAMMQSVPPQQIGA